MKAYKLVAAIGEIGDDLILAAIQYSPKENKGYRYIKRVAWSIAACAVLFIGKISISEYFNRYMMINDIKVIYEGKDNTDAGYITPEQANGIERANRIHNMLLELNLEWYGNCYYDFETDLVRVGITKLSTDNRAQVLNVVEESEVEIYQCNYSYKYLEEVYNIIDKNKFYLEKIGVERYNISVEKNCVNVYISDADNYVAIYVINEITNGNGVVVFKTGTYDTDS